MALEPRPPIITIMGHVDHGKTTLLDYIRKTHVQEKEVGGITQHIGAYKIDFKGKKITFIDTPGHAAFNKMRQRGASVTDIVILVVAANDGVKPQTIESLRYIRESKVPFIVAINKVDLEGVNFDQVRSELAQQSVLVTQYGGDIEEVQVSAKTGKGVDQLLETVVVMADLLELKADPNAPLEAIVIESSKDPKKGPTASVIVKQGKLEARQDLVCDQIKGRVRALLDENSQNLTEVLPACPAEIIGFKDVVEVGSLIKEAHSHYEKNETNVAISTKPNHDLNVDDFDINRLLSETERLKIIVKADVSGTLEAILANFDEDSVELISSGVGPINETDLDMAESTKALIISFHQKVPRQIKNLALQRRIKIKEYDIIYHLIEDIQKQMLKILEPTIDEIVVGEAEILQVFEMKGEKIAGIKVKTGEIKLNDLLHLKRNEEIVANPVIKSMKHGKDDILVVKTKNEAGLTFKNKKIDFQVGDVILAYKLEE